MRQRVAALCLGLMATLPDAARADMFERLTGTFGTETVAEATCQANPMTQVISADRKRIEFRWPHPYRSYTGELILGHGSTVVAWDDSSITLLRDGERRTGPDGRLLTFVYVLVDGLDGYCVVSAGRTLTGCRAYTRCPDLPPVS